MDAQDRPSPRRQHDVRFLQPEELRSVVRALVEEPDHIRTFFLTVLLTGYRRDEVQQMRWKEIDLRNALWKSPASTNKLGRLQTFPLPQALLPYLNRLPRLSPRVFTSSERTNWVNTYAWLTSWKRIQHRAQIGTCQTHILRRSFTHYLAQQGYNPAGLDADQLRTAQDDYAQSILSQRPNAL